MPDAMPLPGACTHSAISSSHFTAITAFGFYAAAEGENIFTGHDTEPGEPRGQRADAAACFAERDASSYTAATSRQIAIATLKY